MFLFGDFNDHHKDWLTYAGETDRSGELCKSFSISKNLTQMANFPTLIPDCDSHRPALLDLFLPFDASICSTMDFPVQIMFLSQFPLTFYHIHNRIPHFITLLMAVLVLIVMVFGIIWEMFHRRTFFNSVPLLLLVNFVSHFRLKFMCKSLIESIRSSLTYLHGFQLLVLLP